jgi:hypothetical protein
LSDTTHAGNFGRPAISSNSSLVVLTFLTSDRRIQAYTRATPYTSNAWSSLKTGPELPAGVTADGIPAIVHMRGVSSFPIQQFVILVRGTESDGTARLFGITFDGNSFGTWQWLFNPFPVDSDPGIEYDDQSSALSVYFRSGDELLQTSVPDPGLIGLYPFYAISGVDSPVYLSAPRVVFGAGFESGFRTAIVRGHTSGVPEAQQSSSILWVEDLIHQPFYPFAAIGPGGAVCYDGLNFSQTFANGINGCGGSVTWESRGSLCAHGSRPCSAAEWIAGHGSTAPTYNYWTNDNLRYSGGPTSCSVSTTTGNFCSANQPMRLCTSSGSDALGNSCNWFNCGHGTATPNHYFGGCEGNLTAGTLCCPDVLP